MSRDELRHWAINCILKIICAVSLVLMKT